MLALKINNIKNFMNQLLIGNTFDMFSLTEASITTFNHFTIDGAICSDFYDTDTRNQLLSQGTTYSLWKDLKPYCYSLIRGKLPPLQFKYIFQLTPPQLENIMHSDRQFNESVQGLFLNIQYKNNELFCTTGVSFRSFVMDKTPEHLWDSLVLSFFKEHLLDFDIL